MAQHMQTNEGGEDEDSSIASSGKPTLKEFLSNEMGQNAGTIYTKLTSEIDITDLDSLIFIDEADLIGLCDELKLSFGEKIKFKGGVRKLKQMYQLPQQAIVTINNEEQAMIDQINLAMKQSNGIQLILEQYFNTINDDVAVKQTEIDAHIDNDIKSLQNRKKELKQNLEQWKSDKLESISKEIVKIVQYHNELKTQKKVIDDLLRKSVESERNKKMKQIIDALFKNNDKYKVYQDSKLLEQYMIQKTQIIQVSFQEQMDMKQLESYGDINKNINSNVFNVPSIVLDDIITMPDNKGFRVILNWKFTTNEQKTPGFIVKYLESDGDNDEKKDAMNDELMEWTTLKNVKIKREKEQYSLNISQIFEFDKKYSFLVEHIADKPLRILIRSNTKNVTVAGIEMNMSKETAISLKIHSLHGSHESFPAENLLKADTTYYASVRYKLTDDWIIFAVNDNNIYYPTKLQIRGRGDNYMPKRIRLKIGNTDSNEWVSLNEEVFTVTQSSSEMQTFNLDIVDNNDKIRMEMASKWSTITSKQYKQFKFEILDHYGDRDHIVFQELKILGVKV